MVGKWADLACHNEVSRGTCRENLVDEKHGSIAVQQIFEVYGTAELMVSRGVRRREAHPQEPCFQEVGCLSCAPQGEVLTSSFSPRSRGSPTVNLGSE
jgi:hypothetical protein